MWEYRENFNEEDYFGFIYKIENIIDGKFYIGKKQFLFKRKIKLKSRKTKVTKVKKSDWENYWGSSKFLLDDIKNNGKENYKRTIIRLCKTKAEQTYYENYYIYENHNLLNPLCYNKHIGHVYAKNIINHTIEDKIKEIDDENILIDYNKGLNLRQLCVKYKISPETLNMIIPKESRGGNKLKGKKWTSDILEQIKILFKNNISHQKIGEQLGLDHGTIKYILNKKLKINTSDRDLRAKRPKGLCGKPIKHIETQKEYLSINHAKEELNISRSIIQRSLKENKTIQEKYTFMYLD
jgi:predicted DNA-binding protein (UPF0251 family)